MEPLLKIEPWFMTGGLPVPALPICLYGTLNCEAVEADYGCGYGCEIVLSYDATFAEPMCWRLALLVYFLLIRFTW